MATDNTRKPRIPARFSIGDIVEINSKIHFRLAGKRAVIVGIQTNRHSHTMDKYTVCIDGNEAMEVLWDIELERSARAR